MTRDNGFYYKCCFILFASLASVLTAVQGHVFEFTVEPIDTVVQSGQSAVLDCVVKAPHHESSVLIQWLDQDHQKLTFYSDSYRSQLTNGSLYITSVVEEQRLTGSYQCMATLPNIGSIVSRTATLKIAKIVGFYEEPRDINVYLRQRAHFSCLVDATPSPRIRWLKDERPLQINELRMTILPNGALEIDEVIESDQGNYRCNATGLNLYKLSNKATLTIINGDHEQLNHVVSPTFIAQPRSDVVIEGQNTTLNCAANGNPTPTITWLKDGSKIDMKDLDSRFSLVGTTNTLRITNIKEEDAGTYQCRAQNREDSLDASATIQVQVPPRFLIKPQDKTESVKNDIEFECNVHGKPEPIINWYKNGEIIKSTEYYQIVNGHNLKIMGLINSDSGLFQCFASNPAGNIQAVATLKVIYPECTNNKTNNCMLHDSTIGHNKKNNNNNKKSNQNKAQKKNSKMKKYQSYQLFSNLQSESTAKFSDVNFGNLSHLSPRKYYLQDSSISSSPSLSIYDPHSAFTALKSSEINDNINLGDTQTAFFPNASPKPFIADSSTTEGVPGPPQDLRAPFVKAQFVILSWKSPILNHEHIQTYSVYYRQEESERERIQNTSRARLEEINIGGLTPGRVYHFRVVGINSVGIGASSDILTITTQSEENVSSAPLNFIAFPTSPHTIYVSWDPPQTPKGIIKTYTVYYMATISSFEHNIKTSDLKYELTDLTPYTEYSIWIVAVNENGPGAATEEKIVRTFSTSPSEPPQNITLEPSSTSITVHWEPPSLNEQNGVITGYKLRYRKQGKKGLTITTPGNQHWYVINDLERGLLYQIKLWAININGTSPSTDWIDIKTYENDLDEERVPDKPGPLKVRPTSNKLHVFWTPPANQNIKVRHYILGWGKGIPDTYSKELDEKTRNYIIDHLEPISEYVISLRAVNNKGAGESVYTTIRTQDEPPPEPQPPLIPPVGLKAQVLSPTSVVLYWTDTTISKSKYVQDNRFYIVKYTAEKSTKSRYLNVSDVHTMIDDLKPNTAYEFTVKLVKGYKESPWSMVVQNTTWEPPPSVAPRDLDVHLKNDESELVELTWQPPKTTTGRITGYVILYTDNKTTSDREWLVQAIKGDKHSSVVVDLKPFTEYYFKVQARNSRGYGPFSNIVMFRTGQHVGSLAASSGHHSGTKGLFSNPILIYLMAAGCIVVISITAAVIVFYCCRRKDPLTSPDRNKKCYQKNNQGVKQPPDLWIHHDQMELKAMEKSQSNNDGASSSGALTLPRSIGGGGVNEYDNHDTIQTNSLDKRNYVTSYMGVTTDDKKKIKPKPITLPVNSKPPREPIATPINTTTLSQSSSDSTPSSRPPYPRTQYNMPRAHVTVDPTTMSSSQIQENPYSLHPVGCYDAHGNVIMSSPVSSSAIAVSSSSPSSAPTYTSAVQPIPPPVSNSIGTYTPGLSVLVEKRLPNQGHPLKSFTVPAPPPISAPGTPQPKHIVRPNSSPFKKLSTNNSSTLTSAPPSRINPSNPPPHTAEEVQRLQPSHSTEELNQEMANLEGLMLTLNAITANEFEC